MHNLKIKIGAILISLLFLQCNVKKSENTENTSNTKSLTVTKNLEYFKDYYPSKNIKVEGQYRDTKKTGKWTFYYENGKVRSIENFKNGKRNGYHKTDYSDELQMEGLSEKKTAKAAKKISKSYVKSIAKSLNPEQLKLLKDHKKEIRKEFLKIALR